MLQFVTEGHILLLALKLAEMQSLQDDPVIEGEKLDWLDVLARKVVDRCWMQPSTEEIGKVAQGLRDPKATDVYAFCICQEGKYCFCSI